MLARANADGLRDKIDNYVRGYADVGLFSGVVLVSKGDSTVYEGAFRLANRTFAVPNKVDAKFKIASLSKPITAAAVLQLTESGKLSLDDYWRN